MHTLHGISYRIKFDNYSSQSSASPEEIGMKDQNTNIPSQTTVTDGPTFPKMQTKKNYTCNKCDYKSEVQESLIKHMKTCKAPDPKDVKNQASKAKIFESLFCKLNKESRGVHSC